MLITISISVFLALLAEFVYLKVKGDPKSALVFTLVFSLIISPVIFLRTDLLEYIKLFSVIMLLNMCSINDVIRHESDNIFPILIIALGLVFPTNLAYMLISFGIVFAFFIINIIVSKHTIGGGDIKMICALAFFFGIYSTVSALIVACIVGIVYAVVSKFAARLPDFSKRFAFLPFIEVGYVLALVMKLY